MKYYVVEFNYDRSDSNLRKIEVRNCNNLIDVLGKLVNNGNYYINSKEELEEVLSDYFKKEINKISDKDVLKYMEKEMYGDGESYIEILEDENGNIILNNNEEGERYNNYKGIWYKENYFEEDYKEMIKDLEKVIVLE